MPDVLMSCLHLCNYLKVLLGCAQGAAWEVAGGALCSSGVQTRAAGSFLTLQQGCQRSHVRYGRPCYVAGPHELCGSQIFLFFCSRLLLSRPLVVACAWTQLPVVSKTHCMVVLAGCALLNLDTFKHCVV